MKKRIISFSYALKGLKSVFLSEPNMKIHVGIAVLVVLMGLYFRISVYEWMACVLCIGLVFSSEMFNTAIETVVDLISPNVHPLAGKTKDIAAGAVLITAICSVIIGILIFLPKVLNLFIA